MLGAVDREYEAAVAEAKTRKTIANMEAALASAQSVARTLATVVRWYEEHFGDQIRHISMRPAPLAVKAAVETALAYPAGEEKP